MTLNTLVTGIELRHSQNVRVGNSTDMFKADETFNFRILKMKKSKPTFLNTAKLVTLCLDAFKQKKMLLLWWFTPYCIRIHFALSRYLQNP